MHQRRGVANGRAPVSVRIVNDLEESVAQDDFNWLEGFLARSRLAAKYLAPLRSSLLDSEVEVVAQRSHAANVAGH